MLIRQSKSNMNDQEVHLLDKFVELYKCTLAKTKQQPASVLMSSSNYSHHLHQRKVLINCSRMISVNQILLHYTGNDWKLFSFEEL